ncbi:MAG: topoisomerase DNA-binding C4 zinc finger domain-containing protein [Paenisporosarcina sp.]
MKGKRELINNGTCPRCNGQLINQNGKLGTFKGCNNYPKCLFVLK